ncbi:NAD(P)/FAD-dependent oxidoreductase [Tianweitania populi]|uniref:Cytochrome c4 n=1 Tax=Tianweitania populi TaxID=1607949 RepID=A0A8J3DY51_9HYPH|nr:FAD-binding oxidoreductase [Tianweitania populi]GHD23085.1 cytochrome c4 [Tianweitania populi]
MAQRQERLPEGRKLSVAIIGAGIVGCATALALSRDGHAVTVFDPKEPGAGTSYGNAGAIVTGSVTPTATPAVLRSLPSYLFSRTSSAVLRRHHVLKALPWLRRFIRHGTLPEVERISAALSPLVAGAFEAHRDLAIDAGVSDLLSQEGWLKVYAFEKEFEGSALERRLMQRAGAVHEVLDQADVLELQPTLNPAACIRGLYQPNAGNVRSPRSLAQAYLKAARSRGAQVEPVQVDRLHQRDDGLALVAAGTTRLFDRVIVAAGAWSTGLTKQIGDRVCLDTERGYHISFGPGSETLLNGPVVFPSREFVLSPMQDGLRLVSGDELAGLTAAPDYRRIEALLPQALEVLPALADWQAGHRWMGHRPSTPDSLPVIGRSPANRNVIYAFGHGHLGVTLSATTARLVADLVAERAPTIDLHPYRASRF